MKYQALTPNIGVKSVNETIDFYCNFLGFKKIMSVPEDGELIWAMVGCNQVNLMFQNQESLEEEYPELKSKGLQSVSTMYIKMRDKFSLYEKVKETVYLAKNLNMTPYGIEEFAIRDNNGLILTVAEDTSSVLNYDNFFLPVDDYNASKKFYQETLGLHVKFEFAEQGMVAFAVGGEEPAIILKDKKKFPNAKPTVWIEVSDVNMMYQELKTKNVNFITEPFKIRTGWAVEFIDPSGNILGFADYSF